MSSDAFAIDTNGDGYCFRNGCKTPYKKNFIEKGEIDDLEIIEDVKELEEPKGKITFKHIPLRGISLRTMEFYDLKTKLIDDTPFETGFFYPELKKYKFRRHGENIAKRDRFHTDSGLSSPGLWGKDRFDTGSKDSVTICEGHFDAPSVYEMVGGITAAVSVNSSSSALRDITQDREWVNSFKKIIILFDNDGPGEEAVKQVVTSGLFDYNKLYICKLSKHKDANDYLISGDVEDFRKVWKNSRRYTPDNIISTFSEIERALEESQEDLLAEYPWKFLNDNLYGIHKGDFIVFKGDEGIGKTETFRAIEHFTLKTTGVPIGIIHLEEDNATTIKGLVGYELNIPATLPDSGLTKEDILKGYRNLVKDDEGRVHIYSSFETEDETIFLDNVRFLASAAGCKLILLDHITWLATGMDNEDERKKLDRLSQKLKLLAKELKIAIIIISHTNDDGKTRGSRNISKAANTVIHLSRDKLHLDPLQRNILNFDIEKARLGGKSGPSVGKAIFNNITGKLESYNNNVDHN